MRRLQVIFVLIWAVTALWVALQEAGTLPQGFLPATPVAAYVQQLLCIATAVGGSFLACRLFVVRRVRAELSAPDAGSAAAALRKWSGVRLALNALAILPSAFLYYAAGFSQPSLYCLLIALTASLLCWPRGTAS
ncbi:MAG: hypothetical protein IJ722_02810 [Alloprevotella sp.]|nr:hypothetical protein [Alloprevotella sp.]